MTAFVILHYMAYDMTTECVNTLINNKFNEPIQIIVIDNASSNLTGIKLQEQYQNNGNVHIILNDKNLGFAKGNNIGYEYAKQFNPDFIVIMNNDVLIDEDDFLKKIKNLYSEYHYDVLGPDIYNPKTGKHQNPLYLEGNSEDTVKKILYNLKRGINHFTLFYYKNKFFSPLKQIVKDIFFPSKAKKQQIDRTFFYENPVLQGACYIFSKNFIKKREYAFYPETFLYFEEDILHLQCNQQNLKMIYSPSLQIKHLEDVSTNFILKTDFAKEKMKTEHLIHSMECFLKICKSTK